MKILFDLQDYLSDKPLGELICDKLLFPYGKILPTLLLEQVENVRVVRITNRSSNDAGIEMRFSTDGDLFSDSRLIVVGRIGQSLSMDGARIALFAKDEKDIELAFYEPYSNMYSLTCRLNEVVGKRLYISLTKTNSFFSGLDVFVDSILVVSDD